MRATGVPRSSRISGGFLGNPHTLSRAPVVVVPRLAPDLGRRVGTRVAPQPVERLALIRDSLALDSRGWFVSVGTWPGFGKPLLPGHGHPHLTFGVGDQLAGHA